MSGDSITRSEEYGEKISSVNEQAREVKFQPDVFQIYRNTKTTLTINGLSSTVIEREYVNSVLKSGQMSTLQLRQEAEDFINYNYNLGNDTRGKIWRSKYQECGKIYI